MNTPNYPLAVAIAAAGWSNGETARRINVRAQRDGHRGVAVDHSRVGRWIRRGEKPRPPVPQILAALLTEHLEHSYTAQMLCLTPARGILVPLEDTEHEALQAIAAVVNMPVEDYVRAVLRSVISKRIGIGSVRSPM
ncbi:hypothetical protein FNV65_06235 [Streptomyces sp. S1A1-8]|uniref:hypothetical protein n=1 Tax=unclassified Streptomyces TaxID=2593676 RepID=UPI001164BE20|nr:MULTISPECIES: hypothetical protein [unclassified Streptomyces]QDN75751.1 hypothetical protein FNV64_09220 [Streptomyces sp. S1A1-7]QDN85399.1 hypothetical protein FNV61_06805 [Streptomyces sp. RLB3-6]QDN95960.1 hypothetical protein FNV58_07665 [Streptomyces sp. RLB1-9]QDO17683.1 hypothetical protein FNV65_06235 [Streptomyces sp. S1A1-8]QDO27807.1 hypothetical protein FNV63_06225 [Streptomyces sp. S1A1-3]